MKKIPIKQFLMRQVEMFIDEEISNYNKNHHGTNSELAADPEEEFYFEIPDSVHDAVMKKMRLIAKLNLACKELENDFSSFTQIVLDTVSLPRYNNDTVHAFLMQLLVNCMMTYKSSTGQRIIDELKKVIDALSKKPASHIDSLPDALKTPRAIELWEMARKGGLVDDDYKPIGDDFSIAAILADRMVELLNLTNKWKYFVDYWKIENLRVHYNNSFNRDPNHYKKVKKIQKLIY